MFKIIVSSEEEKQDLLKASRHIHDSNVDTGILAVNTICHLYMAPELIEVVEVDSSAHRELSDLLLNRRKS